jgi:hypothetical protein
VTVEHWIEAICEPARLLLAWQSPDPNGVRDRFAVAEIISEGKSESCLFRYLSGTEVDRARSLGYVGYPAFRLDQTEHRQGVLAALLRRLPPRSRTDFQEYKAQFRLRSDLQLSDFALLAYTEAKLPSDGFSIVNPLDKARGPCQFVLEVAGFRHYVKSLNAPLGVGQQLKFVPEPTNERDSNAVRVEAAGQLIGYVNRLQAPTFLRWIEEGVLEGIVERLNGNPDRPRVLMFVAVRAQRTAEAA